MDDDDDEKSVDSEDVLDNEDMLDNRILTKRGTVSGRVKPSSPEIECVTRPANHLQVFTAKGLE